MYKGFMYNLLGKGASVEGRAAWPHQKGVGHFSGFVFKKGGPHTVCRLTPRGSARGVAAYSWTVENALDTHHGLPSSIADPWPFWHGPAVCICCGPGPVL